MGSGTLQTGGTFVTAAYDGRGRRISKAVNTAGTYLDGTYHYYLDGDSIIEGVKEDGDRCRCHCRDRLIPHLPQ